MRNMKDGTDFGTKLIYPFFKRNQWVYNNTGHKCKILFIKTITLKLLWSENVKILFYCYAHHYTSGLLIIIHGVLSLLEALI